MLYSLVAVGAASLKRERRTFSLERKDLTGLGLSTNVI